MSDLNLSAAAAAAHDPTVQFVAANQAALRDALFDAIRAAFASGAITKDQIVNTVSVALKALGVPTPIVLIVKAVLPTLVDYLIKAIPPAPAK